MEADYNTEQKIKEAAREIFVQKGFAGARMQDIADKAGINKALLHYYFRNKEKLFEVIFEESIAQVIPQINQILRSEEPVTQKIEAIASTYITNLLKHPHLPLFIMHEVSQNPERFADKLTKITELPDVMLLVKQMQAEVAQGKLKPVDPIHLIGHLISLCVFPFMARPLLRTFRIADEKEFKKLMEERKKEIPLLINSYLKPTETGQPEPED